MSPSKLSTDSAYPSSIPIFAHMQYSFENRWIVRICYAVLIVLLGYSIIFYLERTLFTDIAFQSFNLIRTETPKAQVYRFGAALIHLLPWLAIKLSLSLKWVLLFYSVAYPILYLIIFTLIVKVLKNEAMGLALTMLLTFTVYDSFYWPSSELWQGLVMLMLLFAMVLRYPNMEEPWSKIIIWLGVPFVLFYHPLMMFPFLLCWLFFYLREPKIRHRSYYVILLLFFVSLSAKSIWFTNWYDTAKQGEFFSNLVKFFPNYLQLPSYQKFFSNTLKFYYLFPILFFGMSIFYAVKKQWWKLILLVGFCLGHIFTIHIGSPNAAYRFYIEVSYIPLMLYVGTAFCFDVLFKTDDTLKVGDTFKVSPTLSTSNIFVFTLVLVFLIRLNTIWHAHQPFTNRIQWYNNKFAELENATTNRFILNPNDIPKDTLIMTWGAAYETLLLTSLVHPDSAKTIWITSNLQKAEPYLNQSNYFFGDFTQLPIEELPKRYFNLGEGQYLNDSR